MHITNKNWSLFVKCKDKPWTHKKERISKEIQFICDIDMQSVAKLPLSWGTFVDAFQGAASQGWHCRRRAAASKRKFTKPFNLLFQKTQPPFGSICYSLYDIFWNLIIQVSSGVQFKSWGSDVLLYPTSRPIAVSKTWAADGCFGKLPSMGMFQEKS